MENRPTLLTYWVIEGGENFYQTTQWKTVLNQAIKDMSESKRPHGYDCYLSFEMAMETPERVNILDFILETNRVKKSLPEDRGECALWIVNTGRAMTGRELLRGDQRVSPSCGEPPRLSRTELAMASSGVRG